ncbi:natural killer cell receptor 2B4-like [Sarcoramphus papa]
MAMGNQAELAAGEQEGLCWRLRVWGTSGLQRPCLIPSHGASPRAAGPRSSLSALGPPECREEAVSADGTLQLQPEKPPQGWAKVEWRARLEAGYQQRILTAERDKAAPPSKGVFSGRADFQQETLSLRIRPVSTADSGVYRADFEDTSGLVTALCFRVSVWEPVGQPRLEARILHWEQGWCNLSLVCTVPGAGNVSYNWSCSGDPLGALEHRPWLRLQVPGDADPTVCCCNASNPVSWSTASTDVAEACRAVAPGHVQQMLTVYDEVGKARTGRDPHGTSEATVGGNTIYAVVCTRTQGPSHPQEPESCTIYSTIQPTRKSPSLKRKRLDPALVSTAYVEATGGSRRWCPPSQTSSPAPSGHHLS